ncbi:DUF3786 domain-containing protein [Desulfosporosinus sp. Sb-LF]|nr:DUF3786 domain-containing protein [Desulfosporosinus sp. Sb-LF]
MLTNYKEGGYAVAFMKSREELQKLLPQSIMEGSLCEFNSPRGCFKVVSFGQTIEISYPEGQIINIGSDTTLSLGWRLILLNYLSYAKNIPLSGQRISYRDLPLGNVFYPNIRKHSLEPLGNFFSSCDQDILRQSLIEAGFTLLQAKADIAAMGFFAPRIPVQLHFWEGEEGIPSACQILFDSTIVDQMHIEDSAALCSVIKDHILRNYELLVQRTRSLR